MQTKFVPNDVYATQQNRFQIITGCNMSGKYQQRSRKGADNYLGKSTYIRSIALMCVMAQVGSLCDALDLPNIQCG